MVLDNINYIVFYRCDIKAFENETTYYTISENEFYEIKTNNNFMFIEETNLSFPYLINFSNIKEIDTIYENSVRVYFKNGHTAKLHITLDELKKLKRNIILKNILNIT